MKTFYNLIYYMWKQSLVIRARTPEASAAPSNRFRLGAARTTSTQEQQCLHAICGGGGGERGDRLGRHGGGSDCRGRPAAADASPATTPSPLTADCCSVLHTRPALASNEAHGATTTSDLDTHTHTHGVKFKHRHEHVCRPGVV